jgi:HK97 family phage portal protein
MQRAGVPVTPHTSLQVDAVFTSLRVISNAIIKLGNPRCYTEASDDSGRPYRVWQWPSPPILTNTFGGKPPVGMWQHDGRRRTVISMALFGEAFWLTLLRDRLGYPTMLEVLHPAFVEVKKNKLSGATEYWYGSGVHKVQLENDDVTHIPFMAMPGAMRGLSSIEYGGVAFALALAAMEYGQRWFSQGASPSFLLTSEQKLGQEQIDRIAEKFLIQHSGLQAAHLPLVLDSGMKANKISSTPDEAQFIDTLEYARMCIASYFGLPAHLVGGTADKGNVWGKTVQEQAVQMEDFTLSGYTTPLDEAHSSLLPAGQLAAFNTSKLRQANGADLAAEITAMRTATVKTQNDIRVASLELPPLPGGDDLNAPLASNVVPGAAGDVATAAATEDSAGSNSGGGNS